MSADSLLADYRRRGWATVPIPPRQKGPVVKNWQTRQFDPADFPTNANVGVILGPRSGELVDIDLDCTEAVELADLYLPPTQAQFGRASKRRAHRLYVAAGAAFETFSDPLFDGKNTLLELRAAGRDGGGHQTMIPPSIHPSGERVEWSGEIIAPAVVDARPLRLVVAQLAVGALVKRYISEHAARRPGPDLPGLLWEFDRPLGRAAFKWLGLPDPEAPQRYPRPRSEMTRKDLDLAEVVHEIPNNCGWEEWNSVGLAIYAASGGSGDGAVAFDDWSSKSAKYNPYITADRWRHYGRSPPSRTGIGKLAKLALAAGWRPRADREAS